jgi:hypothetical protein
MLMSVVQIHLSPPSFSRPASAFALAGFLFSHPQPLEKYHEPLSAALKRPAV